MIQFSNVQNFYNNKFLKENSVRYLCFSFKLYSANEPHFSTRMTYEIVHFLQLSYRRRPRRLTKLQNVIHLSGSGGSIIFEVYRFKMTKDKFKNVEC